MGITMVDGAEGMIVGGTIVGMGVGNGAGDNAHSPFVTIVERVLFYALFYVYCCSAPTTELTITSRHRAATDYLTNRGKAHECTPRPS